MDATAKELFMRASLEELAEVKGKSVDEYFDLMLLSLWDIMFFNQCF